MVDKDVHEVTAENTETRVVAGGEVPSPGPEAHIWKLIPSPGPEHHIVKGGRPTKADTEPRQRRRTEQ